MQFKTMDSSFKEKVKHEVKMLLHAHRDCLRNQGKDTTNLTFDPRDGYYGEAFGVLRGLVLLDYGYFGSTNLNAIQEHKSLDTREHNVKWWMYEIEQEVLEEEGYGTNNHCDYCLERYRKDSVRKR